MIDLDVEGSPELCRNILKLAAARYYTNTLLFNIQHPRFCQAGDPSGDGTGGACIAGLLDKNLSNSGDVRQSEKRFLKSAAGRTLTREECQEKGRVVATEMNGIADTVGSQFLITLSSGVDNALDGYSKARTTATSAPGTESGTNDENSDSKFLSLGVVTEDDNNVLDKIASAYCDPDGRPYADIRIVRALVIDDPFPDPPGMQELLARRGVVVETTTTTTEEKSTNDNKSDDSHNAQQRRVTDSPSPERPVEERVPKRIQVTEVEMDDGGGGGGGGENYGDDAEKAAECAQRLRQREEATLRKEDHGRAVVLEMLGDLPDAELKAPENVLFICNLNKFTMDEDLELIFSRFDENVKVEILRDKITGDSLLYAFAEFGSKQQAVEAYFKMNNALVDDRRIKVDFSQSVAKVWDKYNQKMRMPANVGRTGGAGSRGMERNRHSSKKNNNNSHTTAGRGGRGGSGGQKSTRNYEERRLRDDSRAGKAGSLQKTYQRRSHHEEEQQRYNRQNNDHRCDGNDHHQAGSYQDPRHYNAYNSNSSRRYGGDNDNRRHRHVEEDQRRRRDQEPTGFRRRRNSDDGIRAHREARTRRSPPRKGEFRSRNSHYYHSNDDDDGSVEERQRKRKRKFGDEGKEQRRHHEHQRGEDEKRGERMRRDRSEGYEDDNNYNADRYRRNSDDERGDRSYERRHRSKERSARRKRYEYSSDESNSNDEQQRHSRHRRKHKNKSKYDSKKEGREFRRTDGDRRRRR